MHLCSNGDGGACWSSGEVELLLLVCEPISEPEPVWELVLEPVWEPIWELASEPVWEPIWGLASEPVSVLVLELGLETTLEVALQVVVVLADDVSLAMELEQRMHLAKKQELLLEIEQGQRAASLVEEQGPSGDWKMEHQEMEPGPARHRKMETKLLEEKNTWLLLLAAAEETGR